MWREKLDTRVEKILKEVLLAEHDMNHAIEVRERALCFAEYEGVPFDGDVIYAGGTLHDIGHTIHDPTDPNLLKHPQRGMEIAEKLLPEIGFPKEKIQPTLKVIEYHDDTKPWGLSRKVDEIEVQAVQDADNFGAIGITGVYRLIIFGLKVNMPFFVPELSFEDPDARKKSIIHNIYAHMNIYNNLNTKMARELARPRIKSQYNFIINYLDEINQSDKIPKFHWKY